MWTIFLINLFSIIGIIYLLILGFLMYLEIRYIWLTQKHHDLVKYFIYLRDVEKAEEKELKIVSKKIALYWDKMQK